MLFDRCWRARCAPVVLLLSLAGAGCTLTPTAPSAAASESPLVAPFVRDPRLELTAAEQRWAGRGPRNYDFTLAVACFCFSSGPNTVRFEVRNGTSTAPNATAQTIERFRSLSAIDLVFADIHRALDRAPEYFNADYDRETGYPLGYSVDYRRNLADDEFALSIREFVAR
jgi:Family of unknown function (DUF6174)